MKKLLLLQGLLMVWLCAVAVGQGGQAVEVTLEAEVSRKRVYVGDAITYQVMVRGANDGTAPTIDFPDEVRAEYRGASSQKFTTMRSVNGRQRSHSDAYYKHQYVLTVVREGEVTIPAAVLDLKGKRYVSNEVSFAALLPAVSGDDILVVELPDREIYVGESAVVHVSWWVGAETGNMSFDSSVFPESMQVLGARPEQRTMREHPLILRGRKFSGYSDQGVYQGKPMTRLRFDLVVTPTEAGNFEFGPMRVVFTRQDDFARSSRMYVQSARQTMRVVDVPVSGRPAGYEGLIGVFVASTDASNTKVNVGDPIDVRLLVRGPEPMIGIDKTLDAQAFEAKGFRVSPDGWRLTERRQTGERLFTTTIRATTADIEEIPAIRLPAFNPETGAFEVFESEPIPLDVRAVRTVTLSDAVVSGELSGGEIASVRAELARNPSVLWTHPGAADLRASARVFSMRDVLVDPVWIVVLVLIGGVPLGTWIVRGVARRSDPQAVAIERAWRQAKRLHGRGDDVGAIRVYGGAILGIDPESLTGADLKELTLSEEIAQRSAAVLSESENMNFGTQTEIRSDASLLGAMRRDIRRHGANQGKRRAHR